MLFTSDAVASLWARHERLQREARLVEAARRAREFLQLQTTAAWEAAWVSFSESWGDESIHDDFAATDNEQPATPATSPRRQLRPAAPPSPAFTPPRPPVMGKAGDPLPPRIVET